MKIEQIVSLNMANEALKEAYVTGVSFAQELKVKLVVARLHCKTLDSSQIYRYYLRKMREYYYSKRMIDDVRFKRIGNEAR